MFHSMLTWRELDQACFLHLKRHLSPPPHPFFWLTLPKFEVLMLPSVFPSHPKAPAYVCICNFSYENWEDEQEITCICWLVSFITLTEVYFIWAYVLCFWGSFCEMRESTFWISRKQVFVFGRGAILFLNFLFSKVSGNKDTFDHYHPPAEFGFKGNGGMLDSFLCVTYPLVLFFIELRTMA